MDPAIKKIFVHANYEDYAQGVESLKARYLEFPRNVSIETMVRCNAKCSFCPYPESPRKGQEMKDELFYKIVEELTEIPQSHLFGITLTRINEPLLDSRLRKFSNVIAERLPSAKQQFWTNGTMLKEGIFEWMTQYSDANLNVSLNSVYEDEHIQMMGFGLKAVFRGLDYLHRLVEAGRFRLPVILCAPFINEQKAKEYGIYCRKRWPRFRPVIRPFFQWMGEINAGAKERDNSVDKNSVIHQAAAFPCGQWFDLHILANGYTTKCCIDEKGHVGEAAFDVRFRHVLDIYREGRELRELLPARSGTKECKRCLHLG